MNNDKVKLVELIPSQFECEHHGLYEGKILSIMGDKRGRPKCPECEKIRLEIEQESRRKIEQEARRREILKTKERLGIPTRFQGKNFGNFEAKTATQKKKVEVCKSYAAKFLEIRSKGSSMILCGNPGTGKTHLACAILYEIAEQGFSGFYARTFDAIREVKMTFGRKTGLTESEAIGRFTSPDLLVLDEVGVQFGSDTERMIIFEILGKRYDAMKPSILISNLEAQGVADFVGERVVDRLKENGGKILIFDWKSRREES